MTIEEIWDKIRLAVKEWKNVNESVNLPDGTLEFSYRCDKNYEGGSFQQLSVVFRRPDGLWREKEWFKEGTKTAPIKPAVIDRLQARVQKYFEKRYE